MEVTTVGLDLANSWFQVHGADAQGRPLLRKKLARGKLLAFFAGGPPCLIGMEACGSAHHWARELIKLGHEVRLIPPQYVKPYVKGNKHDAADAEAIGEAVTRPTMRFVPVKTIEQQTIWQPVSAWCSCNTAAAGRSAWARSAGEATPICAYC